jgi:hypothetical protein
MTTPRVSARIALLAASCLLAFPLGLEAQMSWTPVFQDTFSLNGTTRIARGDPQGLPLEVGTGTLFRRNSTTVFADQGGIIAQFSPSQYGAGAANLHASFGTGMAGTFVGAGANVNSTLKLTASVTIGTPAAEGWIGIAFLGNPDSPWFGGTINSNPLWMRISADGWLNLDGAWASEKPGVLLTNNPALGFTTSSPVEISLLYNIETKGVDMLFNGVNVTAGMGLFTRNPNNPTVPASMTILNGAGLYINNSAGIDVNGAYSMVHSLSVEYGVIPEPGSVALILGLVSLGGVLAVRSRRASKRS